MPLHGGHQDGKQGGPLLTGVLASLCLSKEHVVAVEPKGKTWPSWSAASPMIRISKHQGETEHPPLGHKRGSRGGVLQVGAPGWTFCGVATVCDLLI